MAKILNNVNSKKFGKNHACVSKFALIFARSSGKHLSHKIRPHSISDRTTATCI
jgi:hypothetical protein